VKKLYVVILIALLTPIAVYAWNDCPYGTVNDPFPGQCPRFIDTNQNGICDHSESPSSGSINNTSTGPSNGQSGNGNFTDIQNASSVPPENYNLIPLAITTIILYLITYLLYLEDRLSLKIYYSIWKYVLTISFLATGVTGLTLTIFINYGIQSPWNLTIDFWHAEFAILMVVSTLFHLHLYWKPVKKVFNI